MSRKDQWARLAEHLTVSPAWDGALCAQIGEPDSLWFADDPRARRVAAEICMACPLRKECLAYALRNREVHGVWGGIDLTRSTKRMRRRVAIEEGIDLDD